MTLDGKQVTVEYRADQGYWYVYEKGSWRNFWVPPLIALSTHSEEAALLRAKENLSARKRNYKRTAQL